MNPIHSLRSGIGALLGKRPYFGPSTDIACAAAIRSRPAFVASSNVAAPGRPTLASPPDESTRSSITADPLTRRANAFLKLRSVEDIDRFSATQLRELARFLGDRAVLADNVPVAENWAKLRQAFNAAELHRLIATSPAQVAEFLARPARGSAGKASSGTDVPGNRVRRLLEQHPIEAIDRMTHGQMVQVVVALGIDGHKIGSDADLVQNWLRLRKEFPAVQDIEQLLHQQAHEVAAFLLEGPGPRARSINPPATAGAPAPGRESVSAQPSHLHPVERRRPPALLAARGNSPSQMQGQPAGLRESNRHGDGAMRMNLAEQHAQVAAEDLGNTQASSSMVRNSRSASPRSLADRRR